VAILVKDYGWKTAAAITVANVATALLVGGLAYRLLSLFI
jgi:ferrous iron transport protein B